MSDSVRIDQMIDCSCGRRHLKSDRCDGPACGVVLDLTAAPCDTMQFVADLDPGHPQHCVIESRWDVMLKKQITVVRYIPDVTTSIEFQRAFNAHGDAFARDGDIRFDAKGDLVTTEMPWPAGILGRMRDPTRAVSASFECAILPDGGRAALRRREPIEIHSYITSSELARDVREGQGRLDDYVRALALFWRARQAAKREARKRRRRRKMRRGWS